MGIEGVNPFYPGGQNVPPQVTYLCITGHWHWYLYERVEKHDFSQWWIWKRAVRFLSHKVIPFCGKKKQSSPKMPKFHKGGPLQTESNASRPNNFSTLLGPTHCSISKDPVCTSWIGWRRWCRGRAYWWTWDFCETSVYFAIFGQEKKLGG